MTAAAIFGCSGPELTLQERAFFRDCQPLGFILFKRNCREAEQIRRLVDTLRQTVGNDHAPVLIDQEGGRVARLPAPPWRRPPAPAVFGRLAALDPEAARRAAWLNARLTAAELRAVGITVNTVPVLDCPAPDADAVIGDRAFGREPGTVADLGGAAARGLLAGGVTPVMKHIPGHGRAGVDSHHALPTVHADLAALETHDFLPFRELSTTVAWAMTAHVRVSAVDATEPVTTSRAAIDSLVRERIGFRGVLVSDDLDMAALRGDPATRAARARAAGCDVVLHCSGEMGAMRGVAAGCGELNQTARERLQTAAQTCSAAQDWGIDGAAAHRDLETLVGSA